jgi:hypothetical protein
MLVDIMILSNWKGLAPGQITQVDQAIADELIAKEIGKKIETTKTEKKVNKPIGK